MPRFQLETTYNLIPFLRNLGIHDTFGNADFSGISDSGLVIDKVVPKAFVDVNEEGTRLQLQLALQCSSQARKVQSRSSVMFLIQNNDTGQILFIGRMIDPTK